MCCDGSIILARTQTPPRRGSGRKHKIFPPEKLARNILFCENSIDDHTNSGGIPNKVFDSLDHRDQKFEGISVVDRGRRVLLELLKLMYDG